METINLLQSMRAALSLSWFWDLAAPWTGWTGNLIWIQLQYSYVFWCDGLDSTLWGNSSGQARTYCMDNVLSTSQQEGTRKCMDTPGVLWPCLDWVMHVACQLWNLQANSWLMCSVSISPSLAHGRGTTRSFWCFWKGAWCQHVWNGFNDVWGHFCGEQHLGETCLRRWWWECGFWRRFGIGFASHDVYARQQQLPNFILFWNRFGAFISWTGICVEDWMLHLQHMQVQNGNGRVCFILQLEFVIQNTGDEVHEACTYWFKHVHVNKRDQRNSQHRGK